MLIVGAGFGGIAAAIELRRHGIARRAGSSRRRRDLGGTWYYNSYPGAACDVPEPPVLVLLRAAARLVAPVLAPGRRSTTTCTRSPATTASSRLIETGRDRQRVRAGTRQRCRWTVTTAERTHLRGGRARSSRPASSHQPSIPRDRGRRAVRRATASTRPNGTTTTTLEGKRVAVIGTRRERGPVRARDRAQGARSLTRLPAHRQLVPAAQEPAATRRCVQGWRSNASRGCRRCRRSVRLRVHRVADAGDPPPAHRRAPRRPRARRRSCACSSATPRCAARRGPTTRSAASGSCSAPTSCPRCSGRNVELVTEPIARVEPEGIVTARRRAARGRLHHLGDRLQDERLHVPDGDHRRRRTRACSEQWATGAHAHLGITVPGFPNMFVMYGPNTNTSGGSIIVYLEAQAAYMRQALAAAARARRGRDRGAPRGRGRQRPRAAGALRRHRLDRVRLLVPRRARAHRRQLARLHARVPASRRATLDASEYRFTPLPERVALTGA